MKITEIITEAVKQRLDARCWKGKHKAGTKIKGGVRVNNCVPNESLEQNVAETSPAKASRVPAVLYHATYRPRLKNIRSKGLGAGGKRNWEDSRPGVVYLALDPNVAESYAETSDLVPDEWLDSIVILEISTAGLDPDKFYIDSNVQHNQGDTLEYHGVVPPNNISLLSQNWTKQQSLQEKTIFNPDVSWVSRLLSRVDVADAGGDVHELADQLSAVFAKKKIGFEAGVGRFGAGAYRDRLSAKTGLVGAEFVGMTADPQVVVTISKKAAGLDRLFPEFDQRLKQLIKHEFIHQQQIARKQAGQGGATTDLGGSPEQDHQYYADPYEVAAIASEMESQLLEIEPHVEKLITMLKNGDRRLTQSDRYRLYLLSYRQDPVKFKPAWSRMMKELIHRLESKTSGHDLAEHQQFDQIEDMVNQLAEQQGVDSDVIWDSLESVSDEQLLAETAAWQRKSGKNKNGGLNKKGVASYRREHPGSHLQTAVTTKPSKLKKGSKAAKRRKSFCARMSGMKGPMKDQHGKPTRKALALKKWNCE